MNITFCGGARTVTGSFFVIDTDNSRFAVDCGLFQGKKEITERNYQPFRVEPSSLDFLILTHAHIDHSGLIPKLCSNGFTGKIYCTYATADLASILLPDSGFIQENEVERKNRKLNRAGQPLLTPIYTVDDAQRSLEQFESYPYDEVFCPAPGVDVRLRDAGHILGSAIVEIWVEEAGRQTKLVFSGDLGNNGQRIIKDPTIVESADYLFIESTYGDRLHQANTSRMDQLLEAINLTRDKGGNLVIPSFAVERTQDLIYDLNLLNSQGKIPIEQKIFIDSPLAIAATEIFKRSEEFYDNETRELLKEGNDPFSMPNLEFSRTRDDSMKLNEPNTSNIIISASGMCDAGRIKHHLKHNLHRPQSTVLFVGYQASGTLGRRLLEGEKLVTIHGEKVAVKADIIQIDSYSAHADQAGIMSWLKRFTTLPKRIFLVHGEEPSMMALADLIKQDLKITVDIPDWMDQVKLDHPARPREGPSTNEQQPEEKVMFNELALRAEEAYLEFRIKANRRFQEYWNAEEYEKIIDALSEAEKSLIK